jgi:hypothetical protein
MFILSFSLFSTAWLATTTLFSTPCEDQSNRKFKSSEINFRVLKIDWQSLVDSA